jgi:hypothetical protein
MPVPGSSISHGAAARSSTPVTGTLPVIATRARSGAVCVISM